MKIAYFINTFNSINWGGQATSNGIQYLIHKNYPDAIFEPIDLPSLPFRKIKILTRLYDKKLLNALMDDDEAKVIKILQKMNIPKDFFEKYTHICFNGEGAVHYKSGHLIRFMGLLYMAKKQHKIVASINQTIDLNRINVLENLVSKIYNMCDFVSVREPVSYDYAKKIGIQNVHLIPDAVYGLPKMDKAEIDESVKKYHLSGKYICITGSSFLKRDNKSLKRMGQIIQYTKEFFNMPMVFLANAKTDIWLAHQLQKELNFEIIEPPVKYKDAMAIIANAELLIGGRQHPNIFAYDYHVPYVPFIGNTFKNEGVAKLQEYPLSPLSWDVEKDMFFKNIERVYGSKDELFYKKINIENFHIFRED